MSAISPRKIFLSITAAATVLGAGAPALAGGVSFGGFYYSGHHGHGGYYPGHRYHGPRYHHRRHHYRRHHHHRGHGLSGGEAALIAAGIIGGAIIIDRALDAERERYVYYDDRPYHRAPPPADFRYRRDDRAFEDDGDEFHDNGSLDDELAGGEPVLRAGYNYGAAFNDCKAETRAAARDSDVIVALPARPRDIEELDEGAAVRFVAGVVAVRPGGGEIRRTMICEADNRGVRYLEII